jgi:hypothetical protein
MSSAFDWRARRGVAVIAAVQVLASPPVRHGLEGALATHMLVQLPSLAAVGWVAAALAPPFVLRAVGDCNRAGLSGLLLAAFIAAFWMLPRSIDGAIQDPQIELGKFLSLPLAGAAMRLSWWRLPVLARGAIKANTISMLMFLAWLYAVTPDRLCTSYLRGDQDLLSASMLAIAAVLTAHWGSQLFRVCEQRQTPPYHPELVGAQS